MTTAMSLYQDYPGIRPEHAQPAGLEDVSFYNRRGSFIRAARLTHPNASTAVYIAIGQASFIEAHYSLMNELHRRGMSVCIFEREGEGGSERLLENPQKPPSTPHDAHIADMDFLLKHILPRDADTPTILLTTCVGALIGIQYLHDHPGFFDEAIFCNPLFGRKTLSKGDLALHFSKSNLDLSNYGDRYVPRAGDWSWEEKIHGMENNGYTHDLDRYRILFSWPLHYPDLRTGGYTYGNLNAVAKSMMKVRQTGYVESIGIPVTIMTGTEDKIADVGLQGDVARRLPRGRQILLEGAKHSLWNELDVWRDRLLAEVGSRGSQHPKTEPVETVLGVLADASLQDDPVPRFT